MPKKTHNINDNYNFSNSLEAANFVSEKCESLICKFVPNRGCRIEQIDFICVIHICDEKATAFAGCVIR